MILARSATTVSIPGFDLSEVSTLTVRLELPMRRTIELPLHVFLMLVDQSRTIRQLGLALDECLEFYELPDLVPREKVKAVGATA